MTIAMPYSDELFTLALDFSKGPELPALRERFKEWTMCKDYATAAAFGYLAAMRDTEKEENKEEAGVFDEICAVMDKMADWDDPLVSEEATELVLGLVYIWLKKAFIEDGFSGTVLDFLKEQFKDKVKPGVVS